MPILPERNSPQALAAFKELVDKEYEVILAAKLGKIARSDLAVITALADERTLAGCLFAGKMYSKAETMYQRLLKEADLLGQRENFNAGVYRSLSTLYLEQNRYDTCQRCADKAYKWTERVIQKPLYLTL